MPFLHVHDYREKSKNLLQHHHRILVTFEPCSQSCATKKSEKRKKRGVCGGSRSRINSPSSCYPPGSPPTMAPTFLHLHLSPTTSHRITSSPVVSHTRITGAPRERHHLSGDMESVGSAHGAADVYYTLLFL